MGLYNTRRHFQQHIHNINTRLKLYVQIVSFFVIAEIIEQAETNAKEPNVVPKYDDPYAEGPVLVSTTAFPKELSTDVANVSPISEVTVDCFNAQLNSIKSEGTVDSVQSLNNANKALPAYDSTNNSKQQTVMEDADSGATYDEPWDLRAARLGLESRLRAVHSSPDQLSELMSRHSDPRPAIEYDEPWDRRAREVHRNLISAKAAKEEARIHRDSGGTLCGHELSSSYHHATDSMRHSQQRTQFSDLRNIPTGSRIGLLHHLCNICFCCNVVVFNDVH